MPVRRQNSQHGAAAPNKKQQFDDIYGASNPIPYKVKLLDQLNYIADDAVRQEFDRCLLNSVVDLAGKLEKRGLHLNVVDLCSSFGNTTMAIVNGMSTAAIARNWSDVTVCEKVQCERRFPCRVLAVDKSVRATDYVLRAGIADERLVVDLNSAAGVRAVAPRMDEAHLAICTAGLVYLNVDTIMPLVHAFASADGEGYMIVNFLSPFDSRKADATKRILLEHLDFVGSYAARHRTLTQHEKDNFPNFGDWALLEVWVLARRRGGAHIPEATQVLRVNGDDILRAQEYYETEDAFTYYKDIYGGENLHVGIYDQGAEKVPLGPERIRAANECSLSHLLDKKPPPPGGRVMDMGSGYGGLARYTAQNYNVLVSCVDISAKSNTRNRELTKAARLEHLISIPGERSFTDTGEAANSFDLVVAEDTFLHAGNTHREKAIAEAARVLKPGGWLIFTDIMQQNNCDPKDMTAVYEKLRLDSLASPEKYRMWAESHGLHFAEFENRSDQLLIHYQTVRDVLLAQKAANLLHGKISDAYVDHMDRNLRNMMETAKVGNLVWGYMAFQKPVPDRRILRYKDTEQVHRSGIKTAVVSAAGRLNAMDTTKGPKCLIRLGNLPIIGHVLTQLKHAGMAKVIVLVGFQGYKVEEQVREMLPDIECDGFSIVFHHLENWQQGAASSLLSAKSKILELSGRFLLCAADHLFDPALIVKMANTRPPAKGGVAYCLMEEDTHGFVGMTNTCVKFRLNRMDLGHTFIKELSAELEMNQAHGVEAGLFACDHTLFERMEELSADMAYFTISDALRLYATQEKLLPVTTDNLMWFSFETKESLSHGVETGLTTLGTDEDWLSNGALDPDGRPIQLVASSHGTMHKDSQGMHWREEICAKRWRSAVYADKSYFEQAFEATIDFIVDLAKQLKLRGERVSLVEVGCSTGEVLRAVCDHFRLAVGVDFNANFIDYCNGLRPKGRDDRLRFIHGDARDLCALVQRTCPQHIWSDTKIVACVSNTLGIIPASQRIRVYREMIKLVGMKGILVFVYWNAKYFGDACQNFYQKNPQLCGQFGGECMDFATTTLSTPRPAEYTTKWTSIEEARSILVELGLEEITVEEHGKAVVVAARLAMDDPPVVEESNDPLSSASTNFVRLTSPIF
eukprot:TRINITY_DN43169_c0_g1_i1.p1 TRINITY_DN43169_c0_g1~~TRINITY_DN43169_c0_g1_i1.p1  ORF type:complete len:1161 (-),score=191.56 TRINITY_DN43169_c0_g1_i1:681-4106(-)